jgi:hypothetical protein
MSAAELEFLLADLRELTETNCHGEALEKAANFFNIKHLAKGFEAINTLHSVIGYLDSPLVELRHKLSSALYDLIEHRHGEETRRAVYNCL